MNLYLAEGVDSHTKAIFDEVVDVPLNLVEFHLDGFPFDVGKGDQRATKQMV